MRKSVMITAAIAALCVPTTATAQDLQPQREENVSWHEVVLVKFKPGKRQRAMEIIEDFFAPAGRDAGLPQATGYHFNGGQWDAVYAFTMTGGPADMAWVISPNDVKWMSALSKRAGGSDKAQALLAEWDTLVANEVRQLAHHHPAW